MTEKRQAASSGPEPRSGDIDITTDRKRLGAFLKGFKKTAQRDLRLTLTSAVTTRTGRHRPKLPGGADPGRADLPGARLFGRDGGTRRSGRRHHCQGRSRLGNGPLRLFRRRQRDAHASRPSCLKGGADRPGRLGRPQDRRDGRGNRRRPCGPSSPIIPAISRPPSWPALLPLAIFAVVLPTDWMSAVVFVVTGPAHPRLHDPDRGGGRKSSTSASGAGCSACRAICSTRCRGSRR